jgi:DNA-directed RNA polymerase I subunit RPA1
MDVYCEDPKIGEITSVSSNISFSFYSSYEVDLLSISEIFCPVFFDHKGKCVKWGLCDLKLGTLSKYENCISCGGNYSNCPGHFGHIDLSIPIINPLTKNIFYSIINSKCWYCNYFKIASWKLKLFYIKLLMLDLGLFIKEFHLKKMEFLFTNLNMKLNYKNSIKVINLITKSTDSIWFQNNFIYFNSIRNENKANKWNKLIHFFLEKNNQMKSCQRCKKEAIFIKDKELKINIQIKQKKNIKKIFLNNKNFFFYKKKQKNFMCLKKSKIFSSDTKEFQLKSFQIKKHLCDLWNYENDFCELIWGCMINNKKFKKEKGGEMFFLNKILIPPSRFRPVYFSKLFKSKEGIDSNPQNFYFLKIIKLNQQLLLAMGINVNNSKKVTGYKVFSELESTIFNLFDNSQLNNKKQTKKPIGIRQQLEQKLGLFRMHIMGKRVNYSARSVVVSDPFLKSNQVGFPKIFSEKINISFILNCFTLPFFKKILKKNKNKNTPINSKIKSIETIFGEKIHIWKENIKIKTLQLVEIGKKYFEYYLHNQLSSFGLTRITRILESRDLVLLNRQPSLHRASIMAHKIVIKKKTKCLSLNYINCNPYNADFDGDEMNVHVIQNNLAKAEALILSMTNIHTKIPTHSTPVRSLIQDHIISAIFLTKKDTFFNQNIFYHLLNSVFEKHSFNIKDNVPAILKPKILWTGKQLFSAIIKEVTGKKLKIILESRNKIPKLMFGQDEVNVLIRNGELLRGVLDSTQLGKNKYGLIQAFYEKYGSIVADNFLTILNLFLTFFQRNHGHTAGLKDLIISEKIDKFRTKGFSKEKTIRTIIIRKILAKQGFFLKIKKSNQNIIFELKSISFLFDQKTLIDHFISYLKSVLIEISTNLIENNIPGSLERKLHSNGFLTMTLSGSKGSSLNVFQICTSLGQTELEGKCIPRGDGAKTLPVFFPFDVSGNSNGFIEQRFLTGLLPSGYFFHCMAGREGLLDTAIKTAQSGYLQRSLIKHLENLKINYDLTVRMGSGEIAQMIYSQNGLSPIGFEFNIFLPWYLQNIFKRQKKGEICVNFNKLPIFLKNKIIIMSSYDLSNIQKITKIFYKNKKISFQKLRIFYIENILFNLFQKNLCEPGESIGIIAGQSIGEPCTQMTLNTFHFAGKLVSSYNLGIPRLREILLIASKYPKNPTMSLYFNEKADFKSYILIEKRFGKIFFSDIAQNISTYLIKEQNKTKQIIKIRLLPKNRYKHQLSLNTSFLINQFKKYLKNNKFGQEINKLKNNFFTKTNFQKNRIFLFSLDLKKNYIKSKFKPHLQQDLPEVISPIYENLFKQTFNFCIRQTPKILPSFVDYKEKTVHFTGINFYAVWLNHDLIDINKIFTNDIYALMLTYGIEASRYALYRELENIFKVQAILINKHHLDLISDFMTRTGKFKPFNRMEMYPEKGFQKITYETALQFLTEAAIKKSIDMINSPSSSITIGKICKSGTGYFDIF